jgi:general secretion pathway protein G
MLTGKALSFASCPLSFVLRTLPFISRSNIGIGGQGQGTKDKERRTGHGPRTQSQGFTLLELMIALSVVLILASFAMPAYYLAIQRAREAVLRQDLYTLRSLIDEFTVDKQRPPATLQELVEAGYLRGGIPVDPITGSGDTWRVDIEDVPGPDQTQPGVVDVHSGSDDTALDGTPYSSW